MLVEHLLELGSLLLVGLEADHFEDTVESCEVDSHITMAFMTVVRLQIENFFEVLTVHVANARLVVRVASKGV